MVRATAEDIDGLFDVPTAGFVDAVDRVQASQLRGAGGLAPAIQQHRSALDDLTRRATAELVSAGLAPTAEVVRRPADRRCAGVNDACGPRLLPSGIGIVTAHVTRAAVAPTSWTCNG
jgi:hypothetical protein